MKLDKILWPTDFSSNAAKALAFVTSLSERYQSEVHVLYVLESFGHYGAWYGEFDPSQIEKIHAWEKKTAEKRLHEICENHLEGCPLYIRHIAIGEPAKEILKLVDEEGVGLIVMATHGREGHFHFGSVAEKVVKNAKVPVLTIPAHDQP
jgi:nucleotide-binding universal stress UspA family protein